MSDYPDTAYLQSSIGPFLISEETPERNYTYICILNAVFLSMQKIVFPNKTSTPKFSITPPSQSR
jgi:hypothetical protein